VTSLFIIQKPTMVLFSLGVFEGEHAASCGSQPYVNEPDGIHTQVSPVRDSFFVSRALLPRLTG
jgi:hypothetical protein